MALLRKEVCIPFQTLGLEQVPTKTTLEGHGDPQKQESAVLPTMILVIMILMNV